MINPQLILQQHKTFFRGLPNRLCIIAPPHTDHLSEKQKETQGSPDTQKREYHCVCAGLHISVCKVYVLEHTCSQYAVYVCNNYTSMRICVVIKHLSHQ